MTLQSSSQISFSQINAEFGLGTDMNNYKGTRWFRDTNNRGFFSTTNFSITEFYSKRKNSPAGTGSQRLTSSTNFTIPMFNTLTVTAYSGSGGQAGSDGNCALAGNGGNGQDSYLADYVGTGQGPGGVRSAGYGSRSVASVTLTITDANQNDIIARYNITKYAQIGGGGGGGGTGLNWRYVTRCTFYYWQPYVGPVCGAQVTDSFCDVGVRNGDGGAAGFIDISWS